VADYLGIKNYGPLEWTPQTAPRMRSREVDTSKVNQSVLKAITALWSASVPVTASDPVDKYLRLTRLLTLDSIPDCLRYQATLDYWIEEQPASWVSLGKLPAMIAEVVDSAGRMVAIHKTYLTNDGQKAAVGEVKKLSRTVYPGAINGAAIKLYAAGETLAVAEGIETALAVRILSLFEFPVWATITANGMERLVVPESVKYLIIAADNDSNGRGQEAACRLAKRYAEKCEVKIITPVQPGCDWADVLENQAENDK
jgi:putative DNA primase/helicase